MRSAPKVFFWVSRNCVVCYRRAREQSYTILELKNAVTGGYVLPKEEPTAPEIRSAIGRMLLGQPKAKPGADRDSRAARRTCSAAAVRGAGGDEGRPVKHTIPRLDLDQRQVIVNRASGRNNDVRCRGMALYIGVADLVPAIFKLMRAEPALRCWALMTNG